MSTQRTESLDRLLGIVDRLRAPDGCPWDRKQTLASMAPHLIEEAHELAEAVELGDDGAACEEAGDVLMALTLMCRIAEEERRFDVARAAEEVSDKLIRRHPHVFGEAEVRDAEGVLAQWEEIKKKEREEKDQDASALAGVPAALPALQRAKRLCGKAVAAGFRWEEPRGALDKLTEELGELREAFESTGEDRTERLEAELGDVLLSAAFVAEYLGLDPERACRAAQRRFEERFRSMEAEVGEALPGMGPRELLAAWERAKAR